MLILNLLKKQLVTFLDELISILPSEGDLVVMRFFVQDHIPITDVAKYIIDDLLPLKSHVERKDDAFFLENEILFDKLRGENNSKVLNFKNIWKNNLDETNKNARWAWFGVFITLGEKYQNTLVQKN